jgi:streptogramin lyase
MEAHARVLHPAVSTVMENTPMRKVGYIAFVALLLFGCGQAPTLHQSEMSSSNGAKVRDRIIQSGDGSLWLTLNPPGMSDVTPGIAQGPDGEMWFTRSDTPNSGLIGKIDMSGTVVEYPMSGYHYLGHITAGPDGAMWFTDNAAIGRITTSGLLSEYYIKNQLSGVTSITSGPDGNVWFTEIRQVGKITRRGLITEYRLPGPSKPRHLDGITSGPDGNLWFTDYGLNEIGSISPSGRIKVVPIPTQGSDPSGIVLGVNGKLYFAESVGNKIGEINRSGRITEYALPPGCLFPENIAKGYSGSSIWITDFDNSDNRQLQQFILNSKTFTPPIKPPFTAYGMGYLNAGPDGNMWVPDIGGSIFVALTHVLTSDPASVVLEGVIQTKTLQIHETEFEGGSYTAQSSNPSIASVAPGNQTDSYVVTGHIAGSCSIRVSDSIGNYIDVPVTVQ